MASPICPLRPGGQTLYILVGGSYGRRRYAGHGPYRAHFAHFAHFDAAIANTTRVDQRKKEPKSPRDKDARPEPQWGGGGEGEPAM